jgi:hypothetical protein
MLYVIFFLQTFFFLSSSMGSEIMHGMEEFFMQTHPIALLNAEMRVKFGWDDSADAPCVQVLERVHTGVWDWFGVLGVRAEDFKVFMGIMNALESLSIVRFKATIIREDEIIAP